MQLDGMLSHKCPQLVHIASQIQPDNLLPFYFFQINFNIIPVPSPVGAWGGVVVKALRY